MNKDRYDELCKHHAAELQGNITAFAAEWGRKNPDLHMLGLLGTDIVYTLFELQHAVYVLEKFGTNQENELKAEIR